MHKDYITTNIRMPKKLWISLRHKALQEGKSLAALLREGAQYVLEGRKSTKVQFKNDPFLKIIGAGNAIQDGAVKHDRDIYGNKNFC
ncbi:MAG: hypothetical protein KJ893_06335 [Candidatus Omnitrophica bacterium]|nr:hypothetical protein [Candidatus Omnitrophota bacterium]MBU4478057.1 hypothetical protein [Candidatus Omnitrophota bacterium]